MRSGNIEKPRKRRPEKAEARRQEDHKGKSAGAKGKDRKAGGQGKGKLWEIGTERISTKAEKQKGRSAKERGQRSKKGTSEKKFQKKEKKC